MAEAIERRPRERGVTGGRVAAALLGACVLGIIAIVALSPPAATFGDTGTLAMKSGACRDKLAVPVLTRALADRDIPTVAATFRMNGCTLLQAGTRWSMVDRGSSMSQIIVAGQIPQELWVSNMVLKAK